MNFPSDIFRFYRKDWCCSRHSFSGALEISLLFHSLSPSRSVSNSVSVYLSWWNEIAQSNNVFISCQFEIDVRCKPKWSMQFDVQCAALCAQCVTDNSNVFAINDYLENIAHTSNETKKNINEMRMKYNKWTKIKLKNPTTTTTISNY